MLSEDGNLGAQLTARELDVLRLMADGMTNADIARTLFVSQGTVKFHVKNILRKMQASNRSDASSRYLRLTLRSGSPAGGTPTLR
jgi:DNA-binding NarL/FixJ family response regulator